MGRVALGLLALLIAWGAWPEPAPPALPIGRPMLPVGASPLIEAPVQLPPEELAPFGYGGHTLAPRAVYHIEARVLGRERYRFDSGARISPLDLLLGWGPMSDERVAAHFDFSQSGRFGYWSWDNVPPIPEPMIGVNLANVHMIPSGPAVADLLNDLRRGQLVRISGILVDVHGADGWNWRTSLRRTDRGAGACEVLFATRVQPI